MSNMNKLNPDQKYFVEEFYEDYREGLLTRRQFVRRVAFITGSMAATVITMGALGCTADELPSPTAEMPIAQTPVANLSPVPDAQSPFSVPAGDPSVKAADVGINSQGDEISVYLAQPVEEGSYPAVLVCHENRGLTAHIRDVARRFARTGYVALAIDLLSREGGTDTLDSDQIPGLLSNAPAERHVADFRSGFDYLQRLDVVDGARIAMTGYCFGGGVTWDTATALPELKAAAPFYGRGPNLSQVDGIRAAVLGVYAENDTRINAGINALQTALDNAGVTYQFNIYSGVDHAFHNDTSSRYVEEQATQAWQDTLDWFEIYV